MIIPKHIKKKLFIDANKLYGVAPLENDHILQLREELEGSLYKFVEYFWDEVALTPFRPGFHLEAICLHLEALYKLDIHDLLINLPPRLGKSTICMVLYTAWIWANNPAFTFLATSYTDKLSNRDSDACWLLIKSPKYQAIWGSKFQLVGKQNKELIRNNWRGERRATTILGGNTGLGANMIKIDDPNNVKDAESVRIRDKTNEVVSFVMSSRFLLIEERRRLLTQQRCNPDDASGYLLSNTLEDWVHLCLPEEFERHRKCKTVFLKSINKVWEDPRTEEGQLLWPEGRNAEGVAKLKAGFHNRSTAIRAQLQQDPLLLTGGIFDTEWFKIWQYEHFPPFMYILQSWDTALIEKRKGNDPSSSACTTWGVFQDPKTLTYKVMLLDVFSKQIEYVELRKKAVELFQEWDADLVVVESKVSGYCLKSDLFNLNIPVVGFNPNKHGSKEVRGSYAAAFIESGFIYVKGLAPSFKYVDDAADRLLQAAKYFPNPGPHSDTPDIIDSMSQAIMKLESLGWLSVQNNLQRYLQKDYHEPVPKHYI